MFLTIDFLTKIHNQDSINLLTAYLNKLTKREKEVFVLLIKNKTTKEIAEKLGISEKTVRNHISNAMQKLGVKGRAGAVVELLKLGEISL